MFHGSETWCSRKNDTASLRRMERTMCTVKLIEKKSSLKLMDILGLEEILDRLSGATKVG